MRFILSFAAALSLATGSTGTAGAAIVHRAISTSPSVSGWVPTKTLATIPKGVDLGVLAGATPLRITVALTGNYAGATAMVKHVYTSGDPLYHKFLKPAQFTALFSATPAQSSAVAAYLSSFGMSNVVVNPTRTLVTAQTTAAVASSAFNTTLHGFNLSGSPVFANVTTAEVPSTLAGTVQAIGGLVSLKVHTDDHGFKVLPSMRLTKRVRSYTPAYPAASAVPAYCNNPAAVFPAGILLPPGGLSQVTPTYPLPFCYPGWFAPNNYRLTYGDTGNPTGTNTAIADITQSCIGGKPFGPTYGDGCLDDITADLWESEYYSGIPQTPTADREVDPGVADGGGNTRAAEWDLDTQGAAGIAGGVKEMVYYNMAIGDPADLMNAFAAIAADDNVVVANASLGLCEVAWQQQGLIVPTDFALEEALLQGQTITNSSGDNGSFCSVATNGLPGGVPDMDYPGSSPYVLNVGGTSLMASATTGHYDTEIGWYAGGGGMSLIEPQSPWQQSMLFNGTGRLYAAGNRLEPDIAMDADSSTGIYYYASGAVGVEGGTSLAAPLAEGVWARLQSAHNNSLGAAAPALYNIYVKSGGGVLDQSVAATLTDLNNCTIGTVLGAAGLGGGPCTVPPLPTLPPFPSASNPQTPVQIGPFNDIVAGANGYGVAAPGYDLSTGMGSLDIGRLFQAYGG